MLIIYVNFLINIVFFFGNGVDRKKRELEFIELIVWDDDGVN